jgi:transposase-like protein
MPEYQPVSSAHISAIERPRCPMCNQNRMLLSKLESGRSGVDHRTFECQTCGRVETTVVSGDPMTSGARGWLAGELKPPT